MILGLFLDFEKELINMSFCEEIISKLIGEVHEIKKDTMFVSPVSFRDDFMFPDCLLAQNVWYNNIWMKSSINNYLYSQEVQKHIDMIKNEYEYSEYLGVTRFMVSIELIYNLISEFEDNYFDKLILVVVVNFSGNFKQTWLKLQKLKNKLNEFQIIIEIDCQDTFDQIISKKGIFRLLLAENVLGYFFNSNLVKTNLKNTQFLNFLDICIERKLCILLKVDLNFFLDQSKRNYSLERILKEQLLVLNFLGYFRTKFFEK